MGNRFWIRGGRNLRIGLALILLLAVAGCGGRGTVKGKVTYKDKPVKGGTVIFFSEGKGTFKSPIDKDGSYTIADVPAGKVQISVETDSAKTNAQSLSMQRQRQGVPPKDAKIPEDAIGGIYGKNQDAADRYVKIPPKYKDLDKSGLTYDVTSGDQVHDIPLVD